MTRRLTSSLLLLLSLGLFTVLFSGSAMAIEEPKYRVIEQAGEFELRVYDPKIIAEVEVSGTLKEASNKGFKLIAGFIFGKNTSRTNIDNNEKISMTAPVTMQAKPQSEKISMTAPVSMEKSGEKWRMHFVMPSKYTLATLPKPNNEAVTIKQVDGAKYAVVRFSGFAGKAKADKKTAELEKWLKSRNIKTTGKPELARYNPPWTLPFMRRNEVMIKY
jgi:hypothetical protein